MSSKRETSPMVSVLVGDKLCVGHVMAVGRDGWRAYDVGGESRGVFGTRQMALSAVTQAYQQLVEADEFEPETEVDDA
jgi:hypothetical protein